MKIKQSHKSERVEKFIDDGSSQDIWSNQSKVQMTSSARTFMAMKELRESLFQKNLKSHR